MTTPGRPSWLDRAVVEALAVCPTMQPWEVRVMLIAAAPTIQNAALARVRALAADIEASTSECGGREWSLENPGSHPHYPDEGWSFCDGCSAAQAGDYDSKAIASRIRAITDPEVPA